MKITLATLTAGVFAAGMAYAASETFQAADSDGSGALTADEVITAMPTTTPEEFNAADADGDGALTEAEFAAALQTGLLRTGS